jgi:hypothetical protein
MVESTPTAAGLQPAATGAAPAAADHYAPLVEQWKRQHKQVTEITIDAPGETVRCFIHNPDRNVIAYALTKVMNKQPLEAGEWILNNCFLGGDPRCNPGSEQADDSLVIAAAMEAAGTIELLSANSKKL